MQVLKEKNTMLAQELNTNQTQLNAVTAKLAELKDTATGASREKKIVGGKEQIVRRDRELEGSAIGRSEGK